MNIILANDLKALINQEKVVLVDARGGADALERYNAAHVKNALFVDLETELSKKNADPAQGGRHPLPEPPIFGLLLGKLGITPESVVAVYDDKKGSNAASRFWWMLKAAGHSRVYVVSGGLDSIVQEGLPVTSESSDKPQPTNYPVAEWTLPIVDMDYLSEKSMDSEFMVIDVREHYRYIGESEPIDLIAGHIPGAVNIPFTSNLDENGEFLSKEELAAKYESALGTRKPEQVVVHCGSGVTACHTLLALAEAGLEGAALYTGSWSEWSRNNKPVAIGNN
jgi:thiosulfate/3-mercaptopyruvate sulfurtransferase